MVEAVVDAAVVSSHPPTPFYLRKLSPVKQGSVTEKDIFVHI
jgi:hypothetical protein